MKTNDLKKGTRVKLANGWFATMWDNKKGAIRMAEVEGLFTETGSVFAADIAFFVTEDGVMEAVEADPKHVKVRDMNNALFGG